MKSNKDLKKLIDSARQSIDNAFTVYYHPETTNIILILTFHVYKYKSCLRKMGFIKLGEL